MSIDGSFFILKGVKETTRETKFSATFKATGKYGQEYLPQSILPFIPQTGSGLVLSRALNMTEHLPFLLAGVTLIMVPSSTTWCHCH